MKTADIEEMYLVSWLKLILFLGVYLVWEVKNINKPKKKKKKDHLDSFHNQ